MFVSNKPFRLKKLTFRNVSLKAMKLTFRAALHLGLAMLWQLFHNYSPSFLSVGIANDLSNCLAMLWQQFHIHHPAQFWSASPCNFGFQFHMTHSTLARHRHWPFKLSVGHSSFSPAVVLALLRLPFSASFFGFLFFFFFIFLLLFLLLLLLLLLLLRLPAATALAVAAAAANATAALRLLLRPLPAAAAATAPGAAAAAPGSKRKLTNSCSPAWKPLFLDLETLVLKP